MRLERRQTCCWASSDPCKKLITEYVEQTKVFRWFPYCEEMLRSAKNLIPFPKISTFNLNVLLVFVNYLSSYALYDTRNAAGSGYIVFIHKCMEPSSGLYRLLRVWTFQICLQISDIRYGEQSKVQSKLTDERKCSVKFWSSLVFLKMSKRTQNSTFLGLLLTGNWHILIRILL